MGSVLSTLNCLINHLFGYFSQFAFLRQQQEPKVMHFNSLPAKVVVDIFSRMTPTELLATERVDRNWQRLVRETLEGRVETVEMDTDDDEYVWSVCDHLRDTRKTMSLKKLFYHIIKEKGRKLEEALGREYSFVWFFDGLQAQHGMQLFTSCLSKLRGVRSIDFTEMKISVQTLVQVFELCPQLDCVTVCCDLDFFGFLRDLINLDENDWTDFINRFGHRLVHLFVYKIANSERLLQLLFNLTNNLNKLEILGFGFGNLTEETVTTIKQLQEKRNIYFKIRFSDIVNVESQLDFIDEMVVKALPWHLLPDDCRRLSLLRLRIVRRELDLNLDFPDQYKSINFSKLKMLIVIRITEFTFQVLIRCHYPNLKKLKIKFALLIVDVDQKLGQLFEKMPLLAEIDTQDGLHQHSVPGPSILRITNLTEIVWRVFIRLNLDFQLIAESFDIIRQVSWLKRLTFKYRLQRISHALGDHSLIPVEQLNQWQHEIDQQVAAFRKLRPDLVFEALVAKTWRS